MAEISAALLSDSDKAALGCGPQVGAVRATGREGGVAALTAGNRADQRGGRASRHGGRWDTDVGWNRGRFPYYRGRPQDATVSRRSMRYLTAAHGRSNQRTVYGRQPSTGDGGHFDPRNPSPDLR